MSKSFNELREKMSPERRQSNFKESQRQVAAMKISKEQPEEQEIIAHLDLAVLATIGKDCDGGQELREIKLASIEDGEGVYLEGFSNEAGESLCDVIKDKLGVVIVDSVVGK